MQVVWQGENETRLASSSTTSHAALYSCECGPERCSYSFWTFAWTSARARVHLSVRRARSRRKGPEPELARERHCRGASRRLNVSAVLALEGDVNRSAPDLRRAESCRRAGQHADMVQRRGTARTSWATSRSSLAALSASTPPDLTSVARLASRPSSCAVSASCATQSPSLIEASALERVSPPPDELRQEHAHLSAHQRT